MVSDDMLYKLSKKIAQLTKVIYSLNTKNDDLEFDMENMRHGYEDKLEKVSLIFDAQTPPCIPILYSLLSNIRIVLFIQFNLDGVIIEQLRKLQLAVRESSSINDTGSLMRKELHYVYLLSSQGKGNLYNFAHFNALS